MKRYFVTILAGLLISCPASAHPLLEERYDRTVMVRLDPDAVRVHYTVEMNLLAMVRDGKAIALPTEQPGQSLQAGFVTAYANRKGMIIADGLAAWLDRKDQTGQLKFQLEGKPVIDPEPGNTYRLTYKYRAAWSPAVGTAHVFQFEDFNFEDQPGGIRLTIDEGQKPGRLSITSDTQPSDLWGKPTPGLSAADLVRRRKCSAEFVVEPPTAAEKTAPAAPETPASEPAPVAEEPVAQRESPGLVADLWERGLVALFDSTAGVAVILLMAFLFGMGHALTPGHGKTMVAAYLVGEKGTPWHAVVLGLTSTLAHTGSVIILAAVLYTAYGNTAPREAQGWLNLAGGALIFLVGFLLFLQRIRGRADHVHLFADGHHHHSHGPVSGSGAGESSNDTRLSRRFGWARVLLLGLGGGIIPCWDAVLLFLLAMAQGRIGFALPVLLVFSTGLASVLIVLGLTVVFARRRGAARFGEHRWFRLLPIASAVILLIMGVWFLRDGWQALSLPPEVRASSAGRE